MDRVLYGKAKDGKEVDCFILRNKQGMEVRCINYGCRLTNIYLPAGEHRVDVVLGFDSLADYEEDSSGQGAFIGRYANRIEGASFTINDVPYKLLKNEGRNFLHGSLCHRVFDAEIIGENSVSFTYISPDGEDGFPGELWVGVTYTLTDKNELMMDYRALSDKDTHINLTNHTYFDLSGSNNLNSQLMMINGDEVLELDAEHLPTGRLLDVKGGAFDFTKEKPVGRDINSDDPQIKLAGGYDCAYILNKAQPHQLVLAAVVRHPESSRSLSVFTTQPSMQLYTANFLDGTIKGKDEKPLKKHGALCLETQHYPCSPSNSDFPSTLLEAKGKFHEATLFQFGF